MTSNTIIGVSGKMRHGKDATCALLIEAATQRGYTKVVRRAFADSLKEECSDFMVRLMRLPVATTLDRPSDTVEGHEAIRTLLGQLLPTDGINVCDTEGSELLLDWFINDLSGYTNRHGFVPMSWEVQSYYPWIDTFNHPDTKPLFRKLLQWYGTEYRRNIFGESYWLDQMERFINAQEPGTIVIAPDTRFPNEAEFCRHWPNGFVIRVHRPVMDDNPNAHLSETALDTYPHFNLTIENKYDFQGLRQGVYHAWRLYEQYQGWSQVQHESTD